MDGIFHRLLVEEYSTIKNVVLLVGFMYLLRISLWIIRSLWSGTKAFILNDLFRVKLNSSSYGWAVVTGASDGIGKEYAIQLAKCGINVVLMSNVLEDLKSVEKEILDQYKVKVKIIVVDFSGGAEIYDNIRMELSGLEIGILINNVAVNFDHPEYFLNVPDDRLWKIIKMTKMILPDMLERKRGVIVNLSSGCCMFPHPLIATYGATKAFIYYFTLALQYEYAGKGVIIQVVTPCNVATKLMSACLIMRTGLLILSPRDYVQNAIATIGVQSRTFGTMSHALQGWALQVLPSWLATIYSYNYLKYWKEEIIKKK